MNDTLVTTAPAHDTTRGIQIDKDTLESSVLATMPADDADQLRWLYQLATTRNWSISEIAKRTGLNPSTLSRVYRGSYGAGLDNVLQTLRTFRAQWAEIDAAGNPDFIKTSACAKVWFAFDKARNFGSIVTIWGRMGSGKTVAAEQYIREHGHGKTYLIRIPAACSSSLLVKMVAAALGVSTHQNDFDMRKAIVKSLSAGQRLLIIDEFHQVFLTTRGDTAIKLAEFLREIYDRSGCGLALIGTEKVKSELFEGQHKQALEQITDRGTIQVALAAKPTRSDVGRFCAHYGLPVPTGEHGELLDDIIARHGLRKLCLHLRDGAAFAGKKSEAYTWSHFAEAFRLIQALNK